MRRIYLLALLVSLTAISCSKKKSEPSTTDGSTTGYTFLINGVSDVTTWRDSSVMLPLSIQSDKGQEKVTLSASGLPENVTAEFSAQSGTPAFASVLTLRAGYKAKAGNYPIKVKGVSVSGANKEYEINLKVNDIPDCRIAMEGTYDMTSGGCAIAGLSSLRKVTIGIDATKDKILFKDISSFNYYDMVAIVNCEDNKITVPEFPYLDAVYTVSGTGTYFYGLITLELHFESHDTTGYYKDRDCTFQFIRK